MSEQEALTRTASFGVPLRLQRHDTTAAVGQLMAEVGRGLGNKVTTLWAQDRSNYDVDIVVTMKEIAP